MRALWINFPDYISVLSMCATFTAKNRCHIERNRGFASPKTHQEWFHRMLRMSSEITRSPLVWEGKVLILQNRNSQLRAIRNTEEGKNCYSDQNVNSEIISRWFTKPFAQKCEPFFTFSALGLSKSVQAIWLSGVVHISDLFKIVDL